jgi:hypothetical protein
MVVTMNTTSFWGVTPFGLVDYRHFGGMYYLSLQCQRVNPATSKHTGHAPCMAYFLTLKMEAAHSSKMSVIFCMISQKVILLKTIVT